MRITYHGHSCFEIEYQGTRLLIDPFITGNPVAKVKPEELKPHYILLTHGHNDHVGDAVPIAKANDATVIAPHELSVWLGWQGVKAHGMAIGGTFQFEFGKVKMTNALHGAGYVVDEKQQILYMGPASGFVLTLGDKTIYHAGDTGLFTDLKWVGMNQPIDLAFLPIGGNYTMDPNDALIAAEWIGAKHVVPMHYNTFPPIRQDGQAFVHKLEQKGIKGTVMNVEDVLEI